MKSFEITGSVRKETGTTAAKRQRKEEQIPCVLYGNKRKENIHFTVKIQNLVNLLYTPHVYIVNIDVDGQKYQGIIKSLQFNAITDKISHIDFLEISDDSKVTIEIPINIQGNAPGVLAGGKLRLGVRALKVCGLPKNLPDVLDVDISNLELNHHILAKDLSYPNIDIISQGSTLIASVLTSRATAKAAEGAPAATAPAAQAAKA
jgi:large subunit ribosomal protein L25